MKDPVEEEEVQPAEQQPDEEPADSGHHALINEELEEDHPMVAPMEHELEKIPEEQPVAESDHEESND